jgi:hypothetical protein
MRRSISAGSTESVYEHNLHLSGFSALDFLDDTCSSSYIEHCMCRRSVSWSLSDMVLGGGVHEACVILPFRAKHVFG